MKGLTNNLIGGEKQQYSSPFPSPFHHVPELFFLRLTYGNNYCASGLVLPPDYQGRLVWDAHTLIGESNQWWNLSPLQMPVLKLGLPEPFSCIGPSLFLSDREKMDLPV